jgi:hypothetical protein
MSVEASEPVTPQAVADYTQALRNMTNEMARGMRAIAENRIEELRSSLQRQQALCAALRTGNDAVQRMCEGNALVEPELATLMAAQKELLYTTRVYKGMVDRGRRTALLLAALCGSCAGQYSIRSWPLRGRLHLSCEA